MTPLLVPPEPPEQREPPTWWVQLQSAFGSWLRTPLATRDGARVAPVASIDPELSAAIVDDGPGATARLALYHEQYWARLFMVFQAAFRRVARAVGYWSFNSLVQAHLAGRSLDSVDLGDATAHFYPAMRAALDAMRHSPSSAGHETSLRELSRVGGELGPVLGTLDVAWSLVSQALAVDEAERRAYRAPFEAAWEPTPPEREALLKRGVRAAPGFSLVKTDWSLFDAGGSQTRLPDPEHIVVHRMATGVGSQRVDAVLARLLSLAAKTTLADAMARVGAASPTVEPAAMAALLNNQVERSLQAGWWVGIRS